MGAGTLATENAEKAEILNASFASVFITKSRLQESWTQETREEVWRKEDFPLVDEDWVRDHLGKPDIHNFMGPDECTDEY